uniref:Uncharacterized protein n=1 Tax=Lactuca sativa TaxID=4236 RepID=A0A9R1WML9_LACSA|nr:hypothetical protein LSAT_V11C900481930 [Lactuca sativa]
MSGYINSALVLNTSIPVSGRGLTITLQLSYHNQYTIISAIEIFEIVRDEAKTLLMKVLLKHFLEFEALKRILMNKSFAEIEPFISVGMVIYVFRNSIHGVELGMGDVTSSTVVCGVLDAIIWCIRFFYGMVDTYRVRLNSRTLLGMESNTPLY